LIADTLTAFAVYSIVALLFGVAAFCLWFGP
jgi:hypothetical protein